MTIPYRDALPQPPSTVTGELRSFLQSLRDALAYPMGTSRNTFQTITSDYTPTVADNYIRVATGASNLTLHMPPISAQTGAAFRTKHVGSSGTIFVVGTVNGTSNFSFGTPNQTWHFQSTGTALEILSSS